MALPRPPAARTCMRISTHDVGMFLLSVTLDASRR
jgi:hypothetical protein